jgi:transcription termination factor Rho
MTADQQLERSVLESKEREELHAIAQALSVKTNTRTKKADIIDGILKAAGVAVSGADGDGRGSREGTRSNGGRTAASGGAPNGAAATRGKQAVHSFGPSDDAERMDARVDLDDELIDVASGSGDASASAAGSTDHAGEQSGVQVVAPGGGHQNDGGRQGASGGGNQQRNRQNNRNQGRNQRGPGDDVGNRRSNRRRRGRERPGPADGDLQGSGAQDQQYQGELIPVRGLLDLRDEGYGFLRCDGYLPSSKDVYVSISQARRLALRKGDSIEGFCRPAGSTEKFPALLQVERVSGLDPEVARNRPRFEDLTPLFPDQRLLLETPGDKDNMTARIVDLLAPIGKGQRGLIVSPPKAGKTTVMKQVAHSIEENNPDVHLMVLLVDERPEEVTDMRRSVQGEVVASTFDRPSEEHTAVAELAIERAKRLVETGRDVVIILDGITRLARAYNLAQPATGRIMSGGVDSGALYPPKKFFGAARNIEEGGSLTILATALVETGSKMDEVIFEEFKGTGNMELRLDRRLSERRLYPSIDVNASSTRHEELLFDRSQLQQVWKLRRVLNALANEGSAAAGLELLMDKIRTTKSNDEFLAEIAKGPAA